MFIDLTSLKNPQRDENFKRLCNEIKRFPTLTPGEVKKLLVLYHTTDSEDEKQKIKERIAKANMRFLISVAKRYTRGDFKDYLDLYNEGFIGMYEAIDKYDISMLDTVNFISYAVNWIKQRITKYLSDYNDIVRRPSNSKIIYALTKVFDQLSQELERLPSDMELLDGLNQKIGSNYSVADIIPINNVDIDYEHTKEEDTTSKLVAEYNIASCTVNACIIQEEDDSKKHMVKQLLHTLPIDGQKIIRMSYGFDGKVYTNDEIAQELGVTTQTVRNKIAKSIKTMQKHVKKNHLKGY